MICRHLGGHLQLFIDDFTRLRVILSDSYFSMLSQTDTPTASTERQIHVSMNSTSQSTTVKKHRRRVKIVLIVATTIDHFEKKKAALSSRAILTQKGFCKHSLLRRRPSAKQALMDFCLLCFISCKHTKITRNSKPIIASKQLFLSDACVGVSFSR